MKGVISMPEEELETVEDENTEPGEPGQDPGENTEPDPDPNAGGDDSGSGENTGSGDDPGENTGSQDEPGSGDDPEPDPEPEPGKPDKGKYPHGIKEQPIGVWWSPDPDKQYQEWPMGQSMPEIY